MYTLGISCYYHDSAVSLLKDGKVLAAVEEERFSRKKFDDSFPKMAIDWCLKEAKISPENIDYVAFYDTTVAYESITYIDPLSNIFNLGSDSMMNKMIDSQYK